MKHESKHIRISRNTVGPLAAIVAMTLIPFFCAQTGAAQDGQKKTLPSSRFTANATTTQRRAKGCPLLAAKAADQPGGNNDGPALAYALSQ